MSYLYSLCGLGFVSLIHKVSIQNHTNIVKMPNSGRFQPLQEGGNRELPLEPSLFALFFSPDCDLFLNLILLLFKVRGNIRTKLDLFPYQIGFIKLVKTIKSYVEKLFI